MAITVFLTITLDGVLRGPGRADEDTRGGFRHAGWADGYQDEVPQAHAAEGTGRGGALVFGRRTYEDLLGFRTTTGLPNAFTDVLVGARKVVVTRSVDTRAAYPNTEVLVGEAVDTVAGDAERVDLHLERAIPTTTGVLIAQYARR